MLNKDARPEREGNTEKHRFITNTNLNRLENSKRKVCGRVFFQKHFMLFSSTLPEKQTHHSYYTQH